MISKVKLINFKSFINKDIVLAPLTVLTGINASGKSSVIQAIRMIDNAHNCNQIELENNAAISRLRSKISKEDNINISFINDSITYNLSLFKQNNGTYNLSLENMKQTDCSISYISSDRFGPSNEYPFYKVGVKKDVGDKGEYAIAFIEENENIKVPDLMRVEDKKEHDLLKLCINDWLNEITPNSNLCYDDKNDAISSYFPTFNGILPTETGVGISSILPIIASLLCIKNNNEILMIENPETYLHPAAQTKIGYLIALAVSCGKQVIVETHSNYVLDGIRIAAKHNKIEAGKVALHFFRRDNFEEETSIESPELLNDGKLSYWPEGFFDQGLKNMEVLLD